jgi:hypothetical protein
MKNLEIIGNEIFLDGKKIATCEDNKSAEFFTTLASTYNKKFTIPSIISKNELINPDSGRLTLKSLRRFINDNPTLDDNTPIMIERIEDIYFENYNWGVYLVEGFNYSNQLERNQLFYNETIRRKNGLEPELDLENPEDYIYSDDEMQLIKEQFYYSWCISKMPDDSAILIYSHY